MRIGVSLRTLGEQGGIAVYSRSLLGALLPLAPQHEFLLFYSQARHLGQFAGHANAREMLVTSSFKGLWDQVEVPWVAAREKVDVLFHTKFAVPLLSRCKTVMVLHGSERFVYPQFSLRSDILFFKTIYPFYLRRASAIISVSENARRDVIKYLHLDPAKVHTVHLATSGQFRRLEDRAALETVRGKYGLPARFVLNVGLIYPGKNIPNLLRALKRVRESEPDLHLVIAGTGKRMYKDELALIRSMGLEHAVHMPGYIPHQDLVAVYNLAQAVVFPSYYESFPAIPLEANACGCPVVTTRTGGTPEAAGDAALYVEPTDVDGIATAMLRVLREPALREDLVAKGYRNVARFSWEKTARATLAILESLDGR